MKEDAGFLRIMSNPTSKHVKIELRDIAPSSGKVKIYHPFDMQIKGIDIRGEKELSLEITDLATRIYMVEYSDEFLTAAEKLIVK